MSIYAVKGSAYGYKFWGKKTKSGPENGWGKLP